MPLTSIASTRSPSHELNSTTLTKPGPAMLVDSTAGCAGSAALIASPTALGFFGAPGCGRHATRCYSLYHSLCHLAIR